MGFGLLILGYFLAFAFNLSPAYFFADVIGALIMLCAFAKLSEYNLYFRQAIAACIAFTLAALANGILISFHLPAVEGSAGLVLNVLKAVSALCMHWFLFRGIRGIADGAGAACLAQKAIRNLVMVCTYYVMYFLALLAEPVLPEAAAYASMLVYLYFLVCLVFNVILFHTCFGTLYPEEGDPMENRRSRIPFLNKLYDSADRLEEEKNRYRRESMEMALREAEKRAAEKAKKYQSGNGKKKKKKK